MSSFDVFPPTRNHPAPSVDPRIDRGLREACGLTPTGLQVVRMIWGQSEEHMWMHFGEIAHRYRHHWVHEPVQMEPVYDLMTGQMKGYGKMYHYGDILPPKMLVPRDIKKSIGVPRHYFEIGMPVDEAEWEAVRYTGDGRDETGPPPEGLTEYFPLILYGMLMRFETHDTSRVKVGNFQVGAEELPICCAEKRKEGRGCYGKYRAPNMRDVEMVRQAFKENRDRQHGFFEKADAVRNEWDYKAALADEIRRQEQRDVLNADDMQQAITMLSEDRLNGDLDLPEADLHKYKLVPKTEALPKHKLNIGA